MRKFVVAAGAVALALSAQAASATENGTQHYPIGVNTIAAGNLPPPGMLQLLNYFQVSTAYQLNGPDGRPTVTDFGLRARANAFRFLYTWKPEFWNGWHYTSGIVVPVVDLDLNVMGQHGHDFQFGDVDLQNYIGKASPDHRFFYYFGVDTYVPSGHYDQHALISTGSNYWTFAPNANVTYNVSPQLELTAVLFSEFNTTNHATGYRSGNDVDLDYGVTYRPFASVPKLGLGVQGYFYQQVSDDTIDGVRVAPDGNRGREFAIGPQIRYDLPFGGIALKWQHEYSVRNRPQGERIWFQFALPIGGTRPAE